MQKEIFDAENVDLQTFYRANNFSRFFTSKLNILEKLPSPLLNPPPSLDFVYL